MKFDEALKNPAEVFPAPEDVVEHPGLSPEQKCRILRQWEYDARELEVAEEENMGGGPDDLLSRILNAINTLDPVHHPENGISGKQGGE